MKRICLARKIQCFLFLVLTLLSQLVLGVVDSQQSGNIIGGVQAEFEEVETPKTHDQSKTGTVVLKENLEGRRLPSSHERDETLSPFSADAGDARDDETDEDEDGEEGKEEFTAFISKRHNSPQKSRCRRRQKVLEFNTVAPTSTSLYDPHTNTFTAPYDGLYTFSIQFQIRQRRQDNDVGDVHIVTDEGQTVVCSISSQASSHAPEHSAGKYSLLTNLQYSSDHQAELLSAVWDIEAEMSRLRRNVEWDTPPRSPWERTLRTDEVRGFCEGVKHLYRGQRVFVRRGDDGVSDTAAAAAAATVVAADGGDDVDDDDVTVGLCDVIGGSFSGSLLTKDI